MPQRPLSRRQALIAIEGLFDLVLSIEQLRRDQPRSDDPAILAEWCGSILAVTALAEYGLIGRKNMKR